MNKLKCYIFFSWFYMILSLVLLGFIFYQHFSVTQFPMFEIRTSYLEMSDDDVTYGLYQHGSNKIVLSSKTSNQHIGFVIYHEYGHWVYNKKMSGDERLEWSLLCNDSIIETYGYPEDKYCEESFCNNFAYYLLHGPDSKRFNKETLLFLDKVVKAYLD